LVGNNKGAILADQYTVWQSILVSKRHFHRWFAALGMVAMLGALAAVPMTTSIALAMAGPMPSASAAAEQMPCHKPVTPCPDCPQKSCPDMGNCLASCVQPLSSPVAEANLLGMVVSSRVLPALSQVSAESLTPPLLRPPSV
jgi:hypothetical protein